MTAIEAATGKELDNLAKQVGITRQYSLDELMSKESTVLATNSNEVEDAKASSFKIANQAVARQLS